MCCKHTYCVSTGRRIGLLFVFSRITLKIKQNSSLLSVWLCEKLWQWDNKNSNRCVLTWLFLFFSVCQLQFVTLIYVVQCKQCKQGLRSVCCSERDYGSYGYETSIHPFSIPSYSNLGSQWGWSLSWLSLGEERQVTPWTGHQSTTRPHGDKWDTQPCKLTLTPRDNLESPINLTRMFLNGGRKPDTNTGRTCKLHTEKLPARFQSWNL